MFPQSVAQPAAPVFSPAPGTYQAALQVTMTEATSGAVIHYTVDGSIPTGNSLTYSGSLPVSTTATLRAVAIASGIESSVSSGTYTIATSVPPPPVPTTATPVISPAGGTYTSAQQVSLTDATPGAEIYYTTDGSAPTTASTHYTAGFAVVSSETVQAIAIAAGYNQSAVASAMYMIGSVPPPPVPTTATPVISPAGGTYAAAQQISLTDATPGAAIYYTTDGSAPTTASVRYTMTFTVASSEIVQAVAIASGYNQSAVASATYTISVPPPPVPTTATPVISPVGGTYTSAQQVSLTDATPGAAIYYTTDGSVPTTASAHYTAAFSVASSATIQAIAIAPGYSQSAVASAVFTIQAPTVSGRWTWMSGSTTIVPAGIYGTQGQAAATNAPGGRGGSMGWADTQGQFWIFGGAGSDANGTFNSLNDLWRFDPATRLWTWISGSSLGSALGVYGTLGVSAPGNVPGGRIPDAVWTDSAGRIWVFGGNGCDSVQGTGVLEDMWMFDPATSLWTWEGGDDALGKTGVYGVKGVASVATHPGGRSTSSYWKDAAGNFWLFGGNGIDAVGGFNTLNDLWMFNPNTRQWTWVSGSTTVKAVGVYGTQGVASAANVPGARYLAVGWADPKGNFWVFGGETSTAFSLLNDLWKFDPTTGQWTWVTGSSTPGDTGSYGTLQVAASSNTPGDRFGGVGAADGQGNLYLSSGSGDSSTGRFSIGSFNDVWRFDTNTGLWTWLSGNNTPVVSPVYGTLGVAAPANQPGSRYFGTGWTDAAGALWLFSGNAAAANGTGEANDLWRFQP